jgi:hypothetical protein
LSKNPISSHPPLRLFSFEMEGAKGLGRRMSAFGGKADMATQGQNVRL